MEEARIGNVNHLSKKASSHVSCIYKPGASSDYGSGESSHIIKMLLGTRLD